MLRHCTDTEYVQRPFVDGNCDDLKLQDASAEYQSLPFSVSQSTVACQFMGVL
jgi:hypothetical protein